MEVARMVAGGMVTIAIVYWVVHHAAATTSIGGQLTKSYADVAGTFVGNR